MASLTLYLNTKEHLKTMTYILGLLLVRLIKLKLSTGLVPRKGAKYMNVFFTITFRLKKNVRNSLNFEKMKYFL